jgi:predicted NBD/HSP70 family sugar kinase
MSTQPGSGAAHASSRAAILDLIRAAGTISRVELTQASGFSAPTVSIVVRRLIEEGFVVEVGHGRSTGGKRPALLQLSPSARFAIGLHLHEDGINFVIGDLGSTIVARWRRLVAGPLEPQELVDLIAREIGENLARVDIGTERVLGIGVVSPSPFATKAVLPAGSPAKAAADAGFDLSAALEEATGLSVLLDNDATAAALGEYWAGGIDADAVFAAIYMGSGLGAGIVLDGTVLRGASSNAGEVGHICVAPDGPPCWCGSRGCLEVVAGPARVVELARQAGFPVSGSTVAQQFAEVARAATRGEPVAVGLLEDSARYVAVAAQTMANLLDLDLIVLTGPAFALAGSLYLPIIQTCLDTSFFARHTHAARCVISANAPYAAAIGATALVMQTELSPRQLGTRGPAEGNGTAAGA